MSNILKQTYFPFAHQLTPQHICSENCTLLSKGRCNLCSAILEYHNSKMSKQSKTVIRSTIVEDPTQDQISVSQKICARFFIAAKNQYTWIYPPPAAALGHICAYSAAHICPPRDDIPPLSLDAAVPQCELEHLSDHTCQTCERSHLDEHSCAPCTEDHLRDHTCKPCARPHLSEHKCAPCHKEHLDEHVCEPVPYDSFVCTRTHWDPETPNVLSEHTRSRPETPHAPAAPTGTVYEAHDIFQVIEKILELPLLKTDPSRDEGKVKVKQRQLSTLKSLLKDLSSAHYKATSGRSFEVPRQDNDEIVCLRPPTQSDQPKRASSVMTITTRRTATSRPSQNTGNRRDKQYTASLLTSPPPPLLPGPATPQVQNKSQKSIAQRIEEARNAKKAN